MSTEDSIHVAERRVLIRSPLSASARVECRRGVQGLGPDLVVDALNISETGIRLLLREAVVCGEEIRLQLRADDLPEAIVRLGKVVWSLELPADGYYYAGLQFDRPVPGEQLRHLAASLE